LIALCTRVGANDGLEVQRDLQPDLPALSQEVELVIYRVAQEALTNTLRHSGAHRVAVSLAGDAESVTLRVTDDGVGLPAQLPGDTAGLAGMRERALLVGGVLSVGSAAGGGTEVQLMVPIGEDAG
jgi:two-component system sensor histidine kinase UhpB